MNTETTPAKWILIVSGIFAVMEIGVSIFMYLSPESVLETVDHTARGIDYLMYMWASRQFALGFIFAFATLKKSIPMLTLAYLFFLVMFIGDLFIGISQHETSLIISAVVMIVVGAGMIVMLNRKKG